MDPTPINRNRSVGFAFHVSFALPAFPSPKWCSSTGAKPPAGRDDRGAGPSAPNQKGEPRREVFSRVPTWTLGGPFGKINGPGKWGIIKPHLSISKPGPSISFANQQKRTPMEGMLDMGKKPGAAGDRFEFTNLP